MRFSRRMLVTPPTLDAAIFRIQEWVKAQRMTKRALAQRIGVALNTLGRVEAPGWAPSLSTLRRLENLIPADWTPPENRNALR